MRFGYFMLLDAYVCQCAVMWLRIFHVKFEHVFGICNMQQVHGDKCYVYDTEVKEQRFSCMQRRVDGRYAQLSVMSVNVKELNQASA